MFLSSAAPAAAQEGQGHPSAPGTRGSEGTRPQGHHKPQRCQWGGSTPRPPEHVGAIPHLRHDPEPPNQPFGEQQHPTAPTLSLGCSRLKKRPSHVPGVSHRTLRTVGRPGPAPSAHSARVPLSWCPRRSLHAPWRPGVPPVPVPAHRAPSARPGPSAPPAASAATSPGHARRAPPRMRRAAAGHDGSASPAAQDYSSHGAARPRSAPPGGRGGPDGVGRDERGAPDTAEAPGGDGARGKRWSPADLRLSGPSSARLRSGYRWTPPSAGSEPQQPRALRLSPHSVPAALVPCPPIAADGGHRSVPCPRWWASDRGQ